MRCVQQNETAQGNTQESLSAWQADETLIGAWSNYNLTLNLSSVNNSDLDSLLKIDNPAEWEQVLKIRPILTVFNADGTYYSEYRDLKDSIVYRPTGIWKTREDSLYLNQKYPTDYMSAYFFDLQETRVEFRALLDWDQDGRMDDHYQGIQRKQEWPNPDQASLIPK